MFIKNLSKAAGALALVGVVAPFLVQSVGAADEPTSALSGVAGVSDPSGSEVLDHAAQSAGGSGTASGTSYAGIGFESGDLILYQVPNFDFSMNNKIADDTYGLTTASTSGSRMAVIVDNRYTAKKAENNKFNWTLSAQAANFNYVGGNRPLASGHFSLLLNDAGGDKGTDAEVQPTIPASQNQKGNPKLVYEVGTSITDGSVTLNKGVNILNSAPAEVASVTNSARPGATGLNFSNKYSAEFVVTADGISDIVPGKQYNSDITWTLTASPLH
ncbi:hypothetical protein GYW21_07790 [Lactobacillus mellis]|nr:hypothetical protein [Bombilactobacillus mellis]